jgi:hypothetical protein
MAKKMERELFFLLIKVNMKVNFMIMKFRGMVNIIGMMEKFIRDNGKIIK